MNDKAIVANQTLPVNSNDGITIKRGQHSKEKPFVMISKNMLRDPKLLPREKGVLCYLLSLPDNWITHPRQVAEALGISKNQMYAVLKELIIAGYATKEESKCKLGRFASVVYNFYEEKLEVPQVYKERIKEKITVSQYPDTDNPDTENGTLIDTYLTETLPKEDISSLKVPDPQTVDPVSAAKAAEEILVNSSEKPKRSKPEFAPKVREVGQALINIIIKHEPEYIPPKNLAPFLTEVDFMIRIDKREPDKVYDVLSWALSDSFWRDKMFKPNPAKYLREKFLQLKNKMEAKPEESKKERKFAPCSDDAKSLAKMKEWSKNAL